MEYEREQKTKHRRKRPKVLSKLSDRTFINERPNRIEMREDVGDIEGDFIVSGKTGKGSLLVAVDRKLRVSFLEKIFPVTIEEVHEAFLRIQKRFPELQSMTTDNDILFQKHKELEKLLGIKIYFCHPYHSWEKGTVENTNKIIRKDIPKGSDISKYSKAFIQRLEEKLNRRPLKCLNYLTPKEALLVHREITKLKKS
ncbi:IS30 family transposase [Candidatus Peregrinibacteria bacterium]|nr:MAG: IS30 family transposase [Candidatus Peregrinibacteria bacterium]